MRRWLLLAALVAGACKGKSEPAATAGSAAVTINWANCEGALQEQPVLAGWNASHLIDWCPVCGDWDPILRWNVTPQQGGPTRAAIEAAMLRCNAYCDANSKQRFLNTLDEARGTDRRLPWQLLGNICKSKVGAVPDQRYASAPMFALDRIARAAGARDPKLLAGVIVPLPAVTYSGVGVDLPEGGPAMVRPTDLALTVLPTQQWLGHLPVARLTPQGLDVDLGKPDAYPGAPVTDLHAQLLAASGGQPVKVTILASKATPASAVLEAVAAAGDAAKLSLGVQAESAPPGWQLPAALEQYLHAEGDSGPKVAVTPRMTVAELAQALAPLRGEVVLVRAQ